MSTSSGGSNKCSTASNPIYKPTKMRRAPLEKAATISNRSRPYEYDEDGFSFEMINVISDISSAAAS
jgi:hypothetical protein